MAGSKPLTRKYTFWVKPQDAMYATHLAERYIKEFPANQAHPASRLWYHGVSFKTGHQTFYVYGDVNHVRVKEINP